MASFHSHITLQPLDLFAWKPFQPTWVCFDTKSIAAFILKTVYQSSPISRDLKGDVTGSQQLPTLQNQSPETVCGEMKGEKWTSKLGRFC